MGDDPTNLTVERLQMDAVSAMTGIRLCRFEADDLGAPCQCGQVATVYGYSVREKKIALFCDACVARVFNRAIG
jgi:hypothetical protein